MQQQGNNIKTKVKKRLFLAGVVIISATVVCVAVNQVARVFEEKTNTLQTEYGTLAAQVDEGKRKISFVKDAKPIYDKLNVTPGQATIDGASAKEKFIALQNNYAIDIPKEDAKTPQIPGISEVTQESLKRSQAVAVIAKIKIPEIYIYSDETLMRFLKQMRADFGGVMRFTRLVFYTDQNAFPDNMKKGKQPVTAEIEAEWYGIKIIATPQIGGVE